jgi:hypothetical protein
MKLDVSRLDGSGYGVGTPRAEGAAVNDGDNGDVASGLMHPDSLTGWTKLIAAAAGLLSALGIVIGALAGFIGGGGSDSTSTSTQSEMRVSVEELTNAVRDSTGYTLVGGPPGNCLYQQVFISPSVYKTHPELHLVGSFRFCIYDAQHQSAASNDLAGRGFTSDTGTQYLYRRDAGGACIFAWIYNNIWFKWTRPCGDVGLPAPPDVLSMIRRIQQI